MDHILHLKLLDLFTKDKNRYKDNTNDTEFLLEDLKKLRRIIQKKILTQGSLYKYIYLPDVLPNNLCDFIICESEKYALTNISKDNPDGWTRSRHQNYPTTDLPIKNIPSLETFVYNFVKIDVFELISKTYSVNKYFLDCNDIFIVKYKHDGQNHLSRHKDGCAFSFNILLNSPKEFEGGGTIIEQDGKEILVSNTKGGLILHSGQCYHQGNAITKGTRYILVGFVSYLKNYYEKINLVSSINLNSNNSVSNQIIKGNINDSGLIGWNIKLSDENSIDNIIQHIDKNHELNLLDTIHCCTNGFSPIEKFVYELAMFHFSRLNIKFDPTIHYIEFWTKNEKNILPNGIIHRFHIDKDEKHLRYHNELFIPILATVTYLEDNLCPTIITNIPNKSDFINNVTNKNIILSFPKKLNHICFDGKFIHGVANVIKDLPQDYLLNNPRKTLMFNLWQRHSPKDRKYYSNSGNNLIGLDKKVIYEINELSENNYIDIKNDNNQISKLITNFLTEKTNDNLEYFEKVKEKIVLNNFIRFIS